MLKTRAKERPQTADSGASGGFGGGKQRRRLWRQRTGRRLETQGKGAACRGQPHHGARHSGGKTAALREIAPELGTVVLEGVLFRKSERVIKSGNYLVSLLITDNKTTICAKAFVSENKWKEIDELLKPGDGVKLRGEVQWDTF